MKTKLVSEQAETRFGDLKPGAWFRVPLKDDVWKKVGGARNVAVKVRTGTPRLIENDCKVIPIKFQRIVVEV